MGKNVRYSECHPARKHFGKGMCSRCYHSAYGKQRYATDPVFRLRQREHHLKSSYGITVEDYDRLLASQGGKCMLCKATPGGRAGNNFGVDHCHMTNRVRGILCKFCNSKLGWFENRRQLIEEYLCA